MRMCVFPMADGSARQGFRFVPLRLGTADPSDLQSDARKAIFCVQRDFLRGDMIMKKMLAIAFAVALAALSGCAGSFYRGMDADGAFVSTAAPQVRVIPAEGFTTVLAGRTTCMVKEEDAFMATVPAQVWYGLSAREGSQLATLLADCGADWKWSISSHGSEYENYRLLREMHGVASGDPDFMIFVRPAAMDPFRGLAEGTDWDQDSLVAQYTWLNAASNGKLIVEYREPAPAPAEELLYTPEVVSEFGERAASAFSRARCEAVPAAGQRIGGIPSDATLGPVLGALEQPPTITVY